MLDQALIQSVDAVRLRYLETLQTLGQVASFQALLSGSDRLRTEWGECVAGVRSPRVQNACEVSFSCAFVGSSGHGKTSVLAEMFPDLGRRGCLGTDVTDTTSQALIIRHAPADSPTASQVTVRSWDLDQIRRLVAAAEPENKRTNVVVRFYADRIDVDGGDATFAPEDMRSFKFPRKQELRPLPRPYQLTSEQAADPAFIRTLTVKETSELVRRGPVLTVDGQAFEALPLRAAIKEVEMREPFSEILRWAGSKAGEAATLVFIDTPGLNVVGSIKDEVLRHILSKKNQQIIVELLRHDELDIIVHLVLNTQQSAFSELWKAVVEQCSPEELSDLEHRLILAVNGANKYFTNDDLKRKWNDPQAARREGDHFAVTLEDNVLKRMSERGSVRPARVCFLDSRRIVESLHGDYKTFYGGHKLMLEFWCTPGAPCYQTLERLGLVDSLRQNIDPLCDPEDRGQGHLVRQILDLLRQNGPRLFVRKHLIRTRLLSSIRKLNEALLRSYDPSGQLNFQAVQDSIRRCLSAIDARDLGSIETFAALHLDPLVDSTVPAPDAPALTERWVNDTFNKFGKQCYNALVGQPGVNRQAAALFAKFFQERINKWRHAWGYSAARMPFPTRQNPTPGDLLRHSLKIHAREMLYQLIKDDSTVSAGNIAQEPQDQEAIRQVLAKLGDTLKQADALCRQHAGMTT